MFIDKYLYFNQYGTIVGQTEGSMDSSNTDKCVCVHVKLEVPDAFFETPLVEMDLGKLESHTDNSVSGWLASNTTVPSKENSLPKLIKKKLSKIEPRKAWHVKEDEDCPF